MDKVNTLYGKNGPHEIDSDDELIYLAQLGEDDYEDASNMENISGEKKKRGGKVENPYNNKRKREDDEMEAHKEAVERDRFEKRGGEDRVYYGGAGAINTVTAYFIQNRHAKKHWMDGRAVVWVECKLFHPRTSIYPVKGYAKHLVDPEFVKRNHMYLNGMLACWRSSVMKLVMAALRAEKFEEDHLENQYQFANRKVIRAMAGIQDCVQFPVHILAKTPLMAIVKGVDDMDLAKLVMKMARCRVFSVIAFPSTVKDDVFYIVTRFDGDKTSQQCFGMKKTKKDKKTPYETVKEQGPNNVKINVFDK